MPVVDDQQGGNEDDRVEDVIKVNTAVMVGDEQAVV